MGKRRYGQWAGNEAGIAEDKIKCVAEVGWDEFITRQCQRKRGYGPNDLYCKQHAKTARWG